MASRHIWLILAASIALLAGSVPAILAEDAKSSGEPKVSLELRNAPVTEALRMLFKTNPGANYVIESGGDQIVRSIKLTKVSFNAALKTILNSAGLTYRMVDDVYTIGPKQQAVISAPEQIIVPHITTETLPAPSQQKTVTEKIPVLYSDVYDMTSFLYGQPGSRAGSLSIGAAQSTGGVQFGFGNTSGFSGGFGSGTVSGYNPPNYGGTSSYGSGGGYQPFNQPNGGYSRSYNR